MRIDELIVIKLDTLEKKIDEGREVRLLMQERQIDILKDVAGLKIRASIWGALAGLVPVVVGLGVWVMTLR